MVDSFHLCKCSPEKIDAPRQYMQGNLLALRFDQIAFGAGVTWCFLRHFINLSGDPLPVFTWHESGNTIDGHNH
ncbi:MAG: hypothetical protein RLZZ165_2024 [Bacteroidota bacterium]